MKTLKRRLWENQEHRVPLTSCGNTHSFFQILHWILLQVVDNKIDDHFFHFFQTVCFQTFAESTAHFTLKNIPPGPYPHPVSITQPFSIRAYQVQICSGQLLRTVCFRNFFLSTHISHLQNPHAASFNHLNIFRSILLINSLLSVNLYISYLCPNSSSQNSSARNWAVPN